MLRGELVALLQPGPYRNGQVVRRVAIQEHGQTGHDHGGARKRTERPLVLQLTEDQVSGHPADGRDRRGTPEQEPLATGLYLNRHPVSPRVNVGG
jgi:hypothetical protein